MHNDEEFLRGSIALDGSTLTRLRTYIHKLLISLRLERHLKLSTKYYACGYMAYTPYSLRSSYQLSLAPSPRTLNYRQCVRYVSLVQPSKSLALFLSLKARKICLFLILHSLLLKIVAFPRRIPLKYLSVFKHHTLGSSCLLPPSLTLHIISSVRYALILVLFARFRVLFFLQSPPPTLRELLSAYRTKGDGDRDLLLAILNAKTAEDQVSCIRWFSYALSAD
jgi:hypothetical protein